MPQQGEQQRLSAWAGFAPKLAQWLEVIEGRGPAAVRQAYLDTLNGRVPPEQGHILSLWSVFERSNRSR